MTEIRTHDPDPHTPDDPGLAAERTALAWGRSTLALLACGAAIARGIPNITGEGRPAVGVTMLVLGGLVWLCGLPLARRREEPGGRRPARAVELAPLAVGTAIVGVAALVIGALFPA